MKKILSFILLLLTIFGFFSFVIFLLEPYYLQEIISNIQEPKSSIIQDIKKQEFIFGEKNINEAIYFEIPIKNIKKDGLKISILKGEASYHLFFQNTSFDSIVSPEKYVFIDLLTRLSKNDLFDCIKIIDFQQNEKKEEICKYIVISNKNYPELRLEIYPLNGTATILLEDLN